MNHFLGIDISKDKFNVSVNGFHGEFQNNSKGFKALLEWLKKRKITLQETHFCMEATGIYGEELALYLHNKNLFVSIVNPHLIKSFSQSLGRRSKTDVLDAETISRFAEVNNPMQWKPPSEEVQALKSLTRAIDDLKNQKQALENRLEVSNNEDVQKSLEKLIKSVEQEIKELEEKAKKASDEDANLKNKKDLLKSIPGIGEQTAQIILAETKGNPEEFSSSRALVAYFGICPSQKQSGSSLNKSYLSKMGSAYFRSKIYFPVLSAIKNNELIKTFYQRLVSRGKPKMLAICACMNKILTIAYAVLKSGKSFDSNHQNLSFSS